MIDIEREITNIKSLIDMMKGLNLDVTTFSRLNKRYIKSINFIRKTTGMTVDEILILCKGTHK